MSIEHRPVPAAITAALDALEGARIERERVQALIAAERADWSKDGSQDFTDQRTEAG